MIEIRGLAKRLGRKQVLQDLDLDVRAGETLVVLGPSGTGKSVLLKHIIGLMRPDAGSIRIDGDEIVGLGEPQLNPVRRRFGMLFQGAALLDSMTVGENVALAMLEHARELDEAEVRRRVLERLEWLGLFSNDPLPSTGTETSWNIANPLRASANAISLGVVTMMAPVSGTVCTTGSVCAGYQASGAYITGNQTITLSGNVTGSGTTMQALRDAVNRRRPK